MAGQQQSTFKWQDNSKVHSNGRTTAKDIQMAGLMQSTFKCKNAYQIMFVIKYSNSVKNIG